MASPLTKTAIAKSKSSTSYKHSTYCCVPMCKGYGRKHPELGFHQFPAVNKNQLKKLWIIAIRRDEGPTFKIGNNTKVCSRHFKKDDFKWAPNRKRLQPYAVPSVFAWRPDKPTRKPPTRRQPATLSSSINKDPDVNLEIVDNNFVMEQEEKSENLDTRSTNMEADAMHSTEILQNIKQEEPETTAEFTDILAVTEFKTECDDVPDEGSYDVGELKPDEIDGGCVCTLCGIRFTERNFLVEHQATTNCSLHLNLNIPSLSEKNLEGERSVKCDICKKTFSSPRCLQNHYRMHTGEKPFCCDVCGKAFTLKSSLTNHTKLHTGGTPFVCDTCGMKFTFHHNLTSHMRKHSEKKPFLCLFCGKAFKNKSHVNAHQRTHTGEKRYKCDSCERAFTKKVHLDKHRRIHKEEPLSCDICGKTFTNHSDLTKHERLHAGKQPFQCDICEKTFTTNSYLVVHQRIHTGEKPFKCNICERTFSQSSNLFKHHQVHSGERPFKCNICEKTYKTEAGLNNHESLHSSVVSYVERHSGTRVTAGNI